MGDGSSPRGRRLGRGRSLPLTRPPNVDFFRESRSPPEPTRPHHAGTHHTEAAGRLHRPPARQEGMLRAAPASPSTSPMEQTPSPFPALDSRWSNTKDGEMPCHAVQPHHDASPGQDGRKSQPLPGKRWCRLVTGGERPFRGHTATTMPVRAREDAAAAHHPVGKHPKSLLLQDITRPRNCRHPVLLQTLACHTPCSFGTKTELESNSQTRYQRVCASWDLGPAITIMEGRQIVPSVQWTTERARVCPSALAASQEARCVIWPSFERIRGGAGGHAWPNVHDRLSCCIALRRRRRLRPQPCSALPSSTPGLTKSNPPEERH